MNRVNRKMSVSDRFEIEFFEGVLDKDPAFYDVMFALADLYTKVGRFEDGLVMDEKLYQIDPENPEILYNLACSYSLVNRVDLSYRTIKKAIAHGYSDLDHLQSDLDLENLRKDRRFQRFFTNLVKRRRSNR